jgi:hypothetical protein
VISITAVCNLLLDEPVSGSDPGRQPDIFKLVGFCLFPIGGKSIFATVTLVVDLFRFLDRS